MENNLYEKPEENREVTVFTIKQKLLIPLSFAIALAFNYLVQGILGFSTDNFAYIVYCACWFVYLAVFYIMSYKTAFRRWESWYLLACALGLFLHGLIYESVQLMFPNVLLLPNILMLHAVASTQEFERGRERRYFFYMLQGWVIAPFIGIAKFFGALVSVFGSKKSKNRSPLLIGLAVGIPLLVIVFALLATADGVLSYYLSRVFEDFNFFSFVFIIAFTLLFYSFIYTLTTKKLHELDSEEKLPPIPGITMTVIISLLLAAYLMFTAVQFFYLTGIAGLPAGMTYSQYAVSGFVQLIFVSLINLTLFGITLRYSGGFRAKKGLLIGLLVSTGVILYSAIARLSMYIATYGLTIARILPMWFMIFICAAVALCLVKLFVPRLNLLKTVFAALIGWYVCLNMLNLDAMIANSIVDSAAQKGEITQHDYEFVTESLSGDAAAQKQYLEENIGVTIGLSEK